MNSTAARPTYLAKERGGSIVEVYRKSPRWWTTLDGRCSYEDGSFEWTAPLARVLMCALAEPAPTLTVQQAAEECAKEMCSSGAPDYITDGYTKIILPFIQRAVDSDRTAREEVWRARMEDLNSRLRSAMSKLSTLVDKN